MDQRLITALDEAMTVDIPRLMSQFPMEQAKSEAVLNPFAADTDPNIWMHFAAIEKAQAQAYAQAFQSAGPEHGKLRGDTFKKFVRNENLGLSNEVLAKVWALSDIDKDGALDADEFTLFMHLTDCVKLHGIELPGALPPTLVPPSKKSAL